jgi:hypothetical protein
MKNVTAAIASGDGKLAQIFDDLYQRTIDFGGHPNQHALFAPMGMEERDGEVMLTSFAFAVDETNLRHVIKSAAQVGLTCLHVLQHVFKAKFELLGIRARLEVLRSSAGL